MMKTFRICKTPPPISTGRHFPPKISYQSRGLMHPQRSIILSSFFFHLDLIGTFVGREPHHERWRHAVSGLELPERHADAHPSKAIAPDCDNAWIFSRGDCRKHLLFEGVEFGIPEILQHLLKSMVTGRVEWVRTPKCILCRVGGIKMPAWNPALRDQLRGRMCPLVMEQLREDVRVRSRRTLAVGARDRLIHLDPPQLAHEHTMGVRGKDHTHGRIAWVEQ